MKSKMSRGAAIVFAVLCLFAILGITITVWPIGFFGSVIIKVLCVAVLILVASFIATDVYKWTQDNPEQINYRKEKYYGPLSFLYAKDDDEKTKNVSFGKIFLFFAVILFSVFVVELAYTVANGCVLVYNKSKMFQNEYKQKEQERIVFYDNLWKTYTEKGKIADVNKETFIEVTRIIMESRQDGLNTAWKWVQENQPIPYEEFSAFYLDLSTFVEKERKAYFEIEKQCQIIAQKNNNLLDTFPNNVYNKFFLNCERINFEYGFISDNTEEVFETKRENI